MQERMIGGRTYRVSLMGTRQGRSVFLRFLTSLAPVLAAVQAAVQATGKEAEATGQEERITILATALGALDRENTDKDLDHVEAAFAEVTQVGTEAEYNGGPVMTWNKLGADYDRHFAGRYVDYLAWLQFCVEVNFLGFLGARGSGTLLAGLAAILKSKAKEAGGGGPEASSSGPQKA
jgi:hypothetical protein